MMRKSGRSQSGLGLPGSAFTMMFGHEYHVVTGPQVEHLGLDAVVVAPSGLFALHTRNWEGRLLVDARGNWQTTLATGKTVKLHDPRAAVAQADRRLRGLLRRELPTLQCEVRHFLVCVSVGIDLSGAKDASPRCVSAQDLAQAITTAAETAQELLEPEECEHLTRLLSGKVAPVEQKAVRPFEFRASNAWGLNRRGKTVQEVARYLEQHPDQGLQDLRSGALEQWFAENGEDRLAALAHEIALRPQPSTRVAIETFLVRSGLVRPPTICVRPRWINAGHMVVGETAKVSVHIGKGRGRGYLFGTLETNNQWIKVSPTSFEGSVNAVITIDSSGLNVTQRAARAELIIWSNASALPLSVPIRNHVHPEPAPAQRYLFRPLVGAGIAGVLGALLGWVCGALGRAIPAWATGMSWLPSTAPAFYAATVGMLWAVLGGWRGLAQRPAWPLGYALRRWLVRVGLWSAIPVAIVMTWYGFIAWLVPSWASHIPPALRGVLPILACLAIIPGTIGEMSAARGRESVQNVGRAGWRARAGRVVTAALASVALLVGSMFAYQPFGLQRSLLTGTQPARVQVEQQAKRLQDKLNQLIDQAYIRLYDRRSLPR